MPTPRKVSDATGQGKSTSVSSRPSVVPVSGPVTRTLGCDEPPLSAAVQLSKPAGAEKVAKGYWFVTTTPAASASKSILIPSRTTTATGSEAIPFATISSVDGPVSASAGTAKWTVTGAPP